MLRLGSGETAGGPSLGFKQPGKFHALPEQAQSRMLAALEIAANGRKADNAKPLLGLGSGVFQIGVRHRNNAYRLAYAVELGRDIWVVHVFQKKSKQGIETPRQEIEIIRARIRALKEFISHEET